MLNIFGRMFGEGFYENSIFLFTRWEMSDKFERRRERGLEKSMDKFYEEFKAHCNEKLCITVQRDQLVFIDNNYVNPDLLEEFEPSEISRFKEQLSKIMLKTKKQ
jgi:hypothetical protein